MGNKEDIVRREMRTKETYRMGSEALLKEHSPRWGTTGTHTKWERERGGNKNEGETRTRGNIPGWDWIGVNRSCVRTGSDSGS